MDRWKRLNVFASLGGLAVCIISALFVKYNPLILCISAFSLGIAWKSFKNIYKNEDPPSSEKVTDPYTNNITKTKKKKKKRDKGFRVFPLGNRTYLSVPHVPQKRKRKSPLSGATAYSSSDSSKSLKDA